jgi:peptide/nickel transport system permease protein
MAGFDFPRKDLMTSWFLRRCATALLLIFVLVTAVFFVVRLAPGDPLDQVASEELSGADRELIRERLGLDRSFGRQYLSWVGGVLRGDFGISLRQHRPVSDILAEAVPATLLLTVTAYVLHLLLAVAAALIMVLYAGRPAARWVNGVGLTLYSLPSFWLGLMLIMVLARKLGWLPAGGMQAPDAAYLGWGPRTWDLIVHLTLPVVTLALGSFMGTARYLRSALAEVLELDHILAARSRGLPERTVLVRHGLRNALLPVITLAGLSLPTLLGGAVVVEVVFGWPGMGRITLEAIWARDYPVIMATTLVAAVAVVAGSLLADLLYQWADPRVRLVKKQEAL